MNSVPTCLVVPTRLVVLLDPVFLERGFLEGAFLKWAFLAEDPATLPPPRL